MPLAEGVRHLDPARSGLGCDDRRMPEQKKLFNKLYDFSTTTFVGMLPDSCSTSAELLINRVLSVAPLVFTLHRKCVGSQRLCSFADFKSQHFNSFGSGWVCWVKKFKTNDTCIVSDCPKSNSFCKDPYWEINILTAKHILYDNEEANKCELVLFDNDYDRRGVVTLSGWKVDYYDIKANYSMISCGTHVKEQGERLRRLVSQCRGVGVEVYRVMKTTRTDGQCGPGHVVCMAHPVGDRRGDAGDTDQDRSSSTENQTCFDCYGGAIMDMSGEGLSVL